MSVYFAVALRARINSSRVVGERLSSEGPLFGDFEATATDGLELKILPHTIAAIVHSLRNFVMNTSLTASVIDLPAKEDTRRTLVSASGAFPILAFAVPYFVRSGTIFDKSVRAERRWRMLLLANVHLICQVWLRHGDLLSWAKCRDEWRCRSCLNPPRVMPALPFAVG